MNKLCQWFGVARRTTDYKPTASPAKVKFGLAEPIKEMIEAEPSFGYRTVAALLGMNKNAVQRIFQVKGWQVRKGALGQLSRTGTRVSRTETPDQLWAADLCRVWGSTDRLAQPSGADRPQHASSTVQAPVANGQGQHRTSSALEQALTARYGRLGRVQVPFLLRSDDACVR